jgi:hypothetical protein
LEILGIALAQVHIKGRQALNIACVMKSVTGPENQAEGVTVQEPSRNLGLVREVNY